MASKKKNSGTSTSNLTKIATWSGVPIHIDTNGMFYAAVDDIEISADKLETVRTRIDAALKPGAKKAPMSLPVIVILEDDAIEITTITGISRTNRELQFNPPVKARGKYNQRVLADTPMNRAQAQAYVEAKAVATKTREAVGKHEFEVGGYGRIEIEAYERIAATLIAAHTKSSKP